MDRNIDALRQALIQAINEARVVNSLLYGARVRLEALPPNPIDALDLVQDFRSELDEVIRPIIERTDRLAKALQNTAKPSDWR
jgi:hypothetical protein